MLALKRLTFRRHKKLHNILTSNAGLLVPCLQTKKKYEKKISYTVRYNKAAVYI